MFSEMALRFAVKYKVNDFTFACSLLCKIVVGELRARVVRVSALKCMRGRSCVFSWTPTREKPLATSHVLRVT